MRVYNEFDRKFVQKCACERVSVFRARNTAKMRHIVFAVYLDFVIIEIKINV